MREKERRVESSSFLVYLSYPSSTVVENPNTISISVEVLVKAFVFSVFKRRP